MYSRDLKNKQEVVIVGEPAMEDDKMGLLSAAEDILASVGAGDPEGLMHALSSFFEMCDAAPHEEGPHVDSHEMGEDLP